MPGWPLRRPSPCTVPSRFQPLWTLFMASNGGYGQISHVDFVNVNRYLNRSNGWGEVPAWNYFECWFWILPYWLENHFLDILPGDYLWYPSRSCQDNLSSIGDTSIALLQQPRRLAYKKLTSFVLSNILSFRLPPCAVFYPRGHLIFFLGRCPVNRIVGRLYTVASWF